jgi:hypothetical protein
MFVWPPMPDQPLEEGMDRKFAHSDRFALAMTIAPAAFIRPMMKASDGLEPASASPRPGEPRDGAERARYTLRRASGGMADAPALGAGAA